MRNRSVVYLLFLSGLLFRVPAQSDSGSWIFDGKSRLISSCTPYGALSHQHEDFFNTTFSYQGIEAGAVINNAMTAAVFFSSFVSGLDADVNGTPLQVTSWKAGLSVGEMYHADRLLHPGWAVSAGYFALMAGDGDQQLITGTDPVVRIDGSVITPELYTEANVLRRLKVRVGIAYSFFSFENHDVVKTEDLNAVSIDFGFIFRK